MLQIPLKRGSCLVSRHTGDYVDFHRVGNLPTRKREVKPPVASGQSYFLEAAQRALAAFLAIADFLRDESF